MRRRKKYEDSGYDDNIFNSKKGRPEHAAQAVCSFF